MICGAHKLMALLRPQLNDLNASTRCLRGTINLVDTIGKVCFFQKHL